MSQYFDLIRNKKVLITGGLGFVGHNLAETLHNKYNCEVVIVDNCCNSSKKVLQQLKGSYEFHEISVLDTVKLFPLFKDVHFIFHLACMTINTSAKNSLDDLHVNGESTLRILDFIKNNPLPLLERFVYTSSCSIYGSSAALPVSENDATIVLSNYAATKLLGENYTMIYNRSYNIPTSSVRYSNVYGYGQSPRNPYCGVLGKFVHNALMNEVLNVFGDGEQTRDYTFITDAVDATILAAVHPKALGDVFNVGTGVETSVNKLAEIISNYTGNLQVQNVAERDIDNIRRRAIGIEKIHQKLGWTPNINVKKGIELTIDWYKTTL